MLATAAGQAAAPPPAPQPPGLLLILRPPPGAWPEASLRALVQHLEAGLEPRTAGRWQPAPVSEPILECGQETCARRRGHALAADAALLLALEGPQAAGRAGCRLTASLVDLRGLPTRRLLRARAPCTDAGLARLGDELLRALARHPPESAVQAVSRLGPTAARADLIRRVNALLESALDLYLSAKDPLLPVIQRAVAAAPPDCAAVQAALREELARADAWLGRKLPAAEDVLRAVALLRRRLGPASFGAWCTRAEREARARLQVLEAEVAEELEATERALQRFREACPVPALELLAEARAHFDPTLMDLLARAQALGLAPHATLEPP